MTAAGLAKRFSLWKTPDAGSLKRCAIQSGRASEQVSLRDQFIDESATYIISRADFFCVIPDAENHLATTDGEKTELAFYARGLP